MPKKDAKYDKEIKTTFPDLTTKRGQEIYKMRKATGDLTREVRDAVLEKIEFLVAGEGKKGRAKSDAAKKQGVENCHLALKRKRLLSEGKGPRKKKKAQQDVPLRV